MSLVSTFLQEGILHGGVGWLAVPRGRVYLETLDPDVFPEGQAYHIQVIATIAEGQGQ